MPTPFETEIAALLRDNPNPSHVADQLVQRWRHRVLSEAEELDCAQFLLAAGLHSLLFEQVARLAGDGAKLPWAQFVEAIGVAGIKPDEFEVRALVEGAESQPGGIAELFKSAHIEVLDTTLASRREHLRSEKKRAIEEKKNALIDKLQFMRSNRLFDQEKQVLEEIQALFPEEPEFRAERESFQLRWAREVIGNSSPETEPELPADLHWKIQKLSGEEEKVRVQIVAHLKKLARETPALAYDFALALHAMELHVDAIDILNCGYSSRPADWLRLELMVLARQFVKALDEGARLEIAYAAEPDAAFAVTYARARSLHGLGQTEMAIDLLSSLVKIRPNYKSAQSLLMAWTGNWQGDWNGSDA